MSRANLRMMREEEAARKTMAAQDDFSWRLRFLMLETKLIDQELQLMRQEERDQTSVDVFWGLETFEKKQKIELANLKSDYDARVEGFRKLCIEIKITRPFQWEPRGKFRDRVTGLPIR